MRPADFAPHPLLRNAHVQSVLGSSPLRRGLALRRARHLQRRAQPVILDAGGGVRLAGYRTVQDVLPQARGLAVLLHGWEGSARSNYILQTGARLLAEGWDVFRLNFRDHGDTHHLNRELFHSCRIDEVVGAVAALARRFPSPALALAGFSLGGNFALRVALRAPAAGIPLRCTVAVCPVVDPHAGLAALERGPRFYHDYFMLKWRQSLKRKQALFPQERYFEPKELAQDMRGLTRTLVERHTPFGSLERYLDGYSIAGDRLSGLAVPVSILTAADDPVIPVADFRRLALPPEAELDIAPYGGHCGFLRDFRLASYAEDYVAARLARATGD
ncbi:putative hydrolase of the alpha/beta-hydrolase fold protein [Mizugakiibacter sediminis]|uniref:Putative hydrolase of the alpha/beta-hydrolase fold protein n=1 Tax=Mizugakiibacter sediminis TaxID=1475481 RepID=A0A0K8QLI2_9GAMM|nr:alpha/beta fold hydrolase [Mizugakiibacter sediminis]GAP65282.1 putative hydrolase of the alpha/beta-hydrolase fold protein [Mizugakiibacter sediminis]